MNWGGRLLTDPWRNLLLEPEEAVAILSHRGLVERASPALAAIARHAVGRSLVELLDEPDRGAVADAIQKSRAIALETTLGEDRRPVRLTMRPLPAPFGAGSRFLVRLRDLTESRHLQQALAQAQRLQSLGQLAGGIAHDFNNLLTAILGASDTLLDGELEPAWRDEATQIRASAKRGAGLVAQLLAFGRQQTLIPKVVAVNGALEECLPLLRRVLPRSIAIELALEQPGRSVRVDPSQLDQVIVNLAVNAGHAMPHGGTLTIATGHRTVLAPEHHGGDILPPGRYATVEVRDTGIGMTAETLSHIFEPFFTTRRESGGTGLGLSTVHGIVRQSGGYLTVASAPGVGTIFSLHLPRHEVPAAARMHVAAPAARPDFVPEVDNLLPIAVDSATPPRRILLVEDEAPILRLATRYLTAHGWDVTAAASADEALVWASDPANLSSLGCVVSDVIMPGMDGPQLVSALRSRLATLPAILMSGYAQPNQREALQSQRLRFLAKPFSMKDLLAALEEMVSLA